MKKVFIVVKRYFLNIELVESSSHSNVQKHFMQIKTTVFDWISRCRHTTNIRPSSIWCWWWSDAFYAIKSTFIFFPLWTIVITLPHAAYLFESNKKQPPNSNITIQTTTHHPRPKGFFRCFIFFSHFDFHTF